MASHNDFGNEAEQIAMDFLIENGHQIIERNYRFSSAEIDIISLKDSILHIVEVKARSSILYGEPQAFVNPKKIKLLVKAANHYIENKNWDIELQFDIISIVKNEKNFKIDYLEDAFSFW